MKIEKKIAAIYAILAIIIAIQAFSHVYIDEGTYLPVGYFMSKGLAPYSDFIEHHNLFYFLVYVPIFWAFPNINSLIAIRVLSIIFTAFTAFLVYKLVEKHKLGNPHYATIFFLAGYTGIPFNFLRNEFFAIIILLLYFYVDGPFLKGSLLTLYSSTSIMFLFSGITLLLYRIYRYRKSREELLRLFMGCALIGILFLIFISNISFKVLYWHLVTINMLIGNQLVFKWYEVVFFSLILAMPYFVIGSLGLASNMKKAIVKESFIIIIGVFAVIFLSSVMTGGIQKTKLPSYLPVLVILSIYTGKMKKRLAKPLLASLFLLTAAVYTPSIYTIRYIENQYLLDDCVNSDAVIEFTDTGENAILLRKHNSYYWILTKFFSNYGKVIDKPDFENPTTICGIIVEEKDIICEDATITKIDRFCHQDSYKNLIYYIKTFLDANGVSIRLAR